MNSRNTIKFVGFLALIGVVVIVSTGTVGKLASGARATSPV